MTPGVERLGYVGVGASDLAAWKDFATQVLGVAVHDEGDDGTLYLRHDKQSYRIAVHPDPCDDLLYIGWQVANDTALDAMRAHLDAYGVSYTTGDEAAAANRRVAELIALEDPNGVKLEIFHSPLIDYEQPFQSPRPIKGFLTGDMGLGHMVIGVDDFPASKQFYREVLGMRVSDYIQTQRGERTLEIVFLHCNPRHHSLGFGSGAGGAKRLGHIMLEVHNLDDVGSTYDICMDRGINDTTIGRHPNDQMVSFYLHSPSGWNFEYGYGARTVNDEHEQVERFTVISEWGHLRGDGARYGSGRKKAAEG
jgi:2,3-dihydroxybiphenyl 1,2-dioxygenase